MINERVCEGCGDCGAEVELPVGAARSRPSSAARPASTRRRATWTSPASTATARRSSTVEPAGTGGASGTRVRTERPTPPARPEPLAAPAAMPEPTPDRPRRRRRALAGIGGTGRRHRLPGPRRRGAASTGVTSAASTRPASPRRAARSSPTSRSAGHAEARGRAAAGRVRPLPRRRPARRRRPGPPRGRIDRSAPSPSSRRAKVPTGRPWSSTRRSPSPAVDAVLGRIASGHPPRRRRRCSTRGRSPRRCSGRPVRADAAARAPPTRRARCRCPRTAIEQAIELNGVAVEKNVQAFRRGRQSVADPDGASPRSSARRRRPGAGTGSRGSRRRARPPPPGSSRRSARPAGSELARLVGIRVPELVAYQDAAYAAVLRGRCVRAAAVEAPTRRLAEAVAVGPAQADGLQGRVRGRPALARPGVRRAVREPSSAPARRSRGSCTRRCCARWGCSASSRSGRGSGRRSRRCARCAGCAARALDPFGRAEVRRVERALVEEYRALVPRLVAMAADGRRGARGADRGAAGHGARLRGHQARERGPLPGGARCRTACEYFRW